MGTRARNKDCTDPSLPRAAGVCGRRKGKGQFQFAQKTAAQGVSPQAHRVVGVQVRRKCAVCCVIGQASDPQNSVFGMQSGLERSSHICGGHLGGPGMRDADAAG